MHEAQEALYKLHNFSLSKQEKASLLRSPDFDWDGVLASAKKAGLTNTLYREIKTLGAQIPEDKLNALRGSCLATLSQNLIKSREILGVCGGMNKCGIDYVIIQGWALIYSLPDNMGIRVPADVDIYVPSEDLRGCVRFLLDSGCVSPDIDRPPGRKNLRHEHMHFSKNNICLEITDDPFKLIAPIKNGKRFLKESRICGIENTKVRVPSYEYSLLVLMVHYQREKPHKITKIYDIAHLIHKTKGVLDWKKFLKITVEERLETPAYFTLKTTMGLFSPPVPDFAVAGLDSGKGKERFLKITESPNEKIFYLYTWLTRESLKEKLKSLYSKIFNPFGVMWDFTPEKKRAKAYIFLSHLKEMLTDRFIKYISAWISLFSGKL